MTEAVESTAAQPAQPEVNRVNMTRKDYVGAASTMCKGCGHDAITASIITACFENSIDPKRIVKLSGIGCSSKTTNYFMNQAFGLNGIHGRIMRGAPHVFFHPPHTACRFDVEPTAVEANAFADQRDARCVFSSPLQLQQARLLGTRAADRVNRRDR